MFQTIDEGVWDEKYADKFGTLPYGVALKQGPRPEMEDFTHIIPRARCGFLFAGAALSSLGAPLYKLVLADDPRGGSAERVLRSHSGRSSTAKPCCCTG